MDAPFVSALAGVLGTLVGSSASVATAWITQKTVSKRERIDAEIRQRETLVHSRKLQTRRRPVCAYIGKAGNVGVRVRADQSHPSLCVRRLSRRRKTCRDTSRSSISPNLSAEELRALVRSGSADPIKRFGEACRSELKSMKRAAV